MELLKREIKNSSKNRKDRNEVEILISNIVIFIYSHVYLDRKKTKINVLVCTEWITS